MSKFSGFTLAVLTGIACSHTAGARGVEVPAVSGPAYTIQPGEERRFRRLINGEEVLQVSHRRDENVIESRIEGGCAWSHGTDDRFSPNLTWENCGPAPWGTGKAVDIKKEGQLWPLQVGNKVHYKYTVVNMQGGTNKKAFRKCKVTDTAMAEAAGKQYPAYQVKCDEHNGTRVFYYAPEVENVVRQEHDHKKNGRRLVEYVERVQ